MSLFFSIAIFIFGLAVGSFLNCVIYRMETGQSFLRGRSFCPHCKHQLDFFDLIPVLSFIFLLGKCRYCGKKISFQYPLVELGTGILFVIFWEIRFLSVQHPVFFSLTPGVISEIGPLILIPFLVVIFVYDLKHYIIPDKIVYPAILIALAYNFYAGFTKSPLILGDFVNLLISAFGAAAFFAAVVLVSRGKWMGVGDIKLAFLMGFILGWPNILAALFLAFFLGAIIGVGLIISGRKKMKSEVPFGPFLVVGTLIALFYGERIINWYVQSFYYY